MVSNKYQVTSKYMVRIPFHDILFKEHYADIAQSIEKLKQEKAFCEQILVSTQPLYQTLMTKGIEELSNKKRRNFENSLQSYLNRASTRTTPFGLFTGVSLAGVDQEQSSDVDFHYKKHARIDMGWLNRLIKKIESKYYSSLSFKINGAVYQQGDRAKLMYNTDEEAEAINIYLSNPFDIINQLCEDESVSYNKIIKKLTGSYPDRDILVLEGYLKQLIEKEFLISELRIPICNTNELEVLISILKNNNRITEYLQDLTEVKGFIDDYNKSDIGDGIDLYKLICSKMDQIMKNETTNYLQVDYEVQINTSIISLADIENMNELINYFINLSSLNQNKYLDEFKMRFLEKYGEYVEVHITDLLDEAIGIGAPHGYTKPSNQFIRNDSSDLSMGSPLREYFMKKYTEAVKHETDISLNDKEINYLIKEYNQEELPNSLELNFIVKQEDSVKRFYLGPNTGSPYAGKTFGRFSHFSEEFQMLLKEIQNKLPVDEEYDNCELSYVPQNSRMANVTRNYTFKEKNISLFVNSHDEENEIKLRNVVVGYENNKLYLRDLITKRKIKVTSNNMLNPSMGSNLIRFIQEISIGQGFIWYDLPWQRYYANFLYVPEIKYKNFILQSEMWRISKEHFVFKDEKITYSIFIEEFLSLKEKFRISNLVYLQNADNRLLLY